MTKLPSVVAQRWLNNYLNRPQRSVLVPEEKALNEMAAAFRLEALEPRLLLSADPVLGELARWVEDDSGKDSEALSAIIQEMNEAAQAELLSGTEAESVERADIAVSWPQAWSESAGDAHEDEHFLRAEGTPSLADGVGNIEQGQAVTALAAAKLRFADLGLDFDETELADITIVAGDLSAEGSDVIAKTNGNVITVDFNAAGFGWYLDPNYADDDEFDEAGGDDATGIDLLSTIMHEIGHVVLGGDHAGADSPDTLMSATISEGERQIAVTLNNVIDSVLANFDGAVPTGGTFTYSTAADQTVVIGTTLDGGRDLELDDLTLSFSDLVFDGSAWSGIVVVEAASGVLLSSVLDVELTDTDDDGNAVVGTIVLGTSTASELDIDSVNVFDSNPDLLTIPSLLSVDITGIKLSFNDFRGNANDNTLDLAVGVTGLKGVIPIELKDKFNLEVVGSFRVAIELDDLEGSAGKAADLLDAFAAVELTGLSLEASGALEGVGTFKKVGVSYKSVVNADDPDDPIDLFTLSGDITLGPKLLGKDKDDKDITKNVSFAFAFSELGPLDAFIGSSTESIAIQGQGYQIKVNGFGLVFNNTIEGRQTSADFDVVNLSVPDYNNGTVTIEIAANDHDLNKDGEFDDVDALKVDDEIRIRNSSNGMLNGLWKVTAVGDGTVTFAVDSDPGTLIGETAGAIVIRHNIREPEDLLDPGFANGIAPPASLADWQAVLEDSVATQVANDDTWGSFSGQFILGAKANVEFRDRIQEEAGTGIAPEILGGKLDFLIDSELNLLVLGNLSVYEGKVVLPAKLFASVDLDLSDSNDPPGVEANFLLNAQLNAGPVLPVTEATKEINAEISAPLVEINAAVSFAYADNEFSIKARGQFDLNVPGDLTTITLEGGAELIFTVAGTLEDPAIDVEFTFGAYLSEEFVGQIGEANGAFKVTISDAGASIYGAAIVTVDDFLSDYGVEFAAEGTFLINTTQAEKTVDIFKRDDNNELTEEKLLSKTITKDQTIAMALVGSAELRIGDVDLLEIQGGFGLQIGKAGVSVGVFADPDAPDPEGTNSATIDVLDIVEGSVSGFFAIVTGEDGDGVPGVAGRLSITARAELEVAETTFATIGGGALMVFNTTGREVEFTPPVENPQTMVVAAGAPSTDLVKNTLEDPRLPQADKFDELSTGTITNVAQISSEWAVEEESAYAVLWLAATGEDDGINIFNGVITGDATASILVSSDGAFALDTRFFLAGDFLGLADGYVGGLLSLTSEADADFISAFAVNLAAGVQLGPDWLNVSGDASIYISYDDTRTTERLEASGTVSAAVNVDIGIVDVSIGASLDIIYEEGELKFGVTYPEPFIDRSCWDTFLGDVCVYYPNIRDAQFVFSVGEFDIFGPGGNPPKLGQVDTNGVLTLNVGEGTGEGTAASRYLEMGDINEIVSIGALTAEQDGAQDIAVSMFGLTQEFKGVKEIRIGDMGNGNDAVYIEAVSDNRVEMVTDLTVTLGDGADLLRNDGAGMVTAHGGKGADELFGGSGIDNLYGGDDNDRISGGGGRDTLEGGGDDDIMIWLAGDGEDIKIDGGAGTGDLLQVGRDDGAALVATVNPNAANSKAFDVSVVGQPTLTAAGVEGLNVIGTDQADTLTVNSLIGNELNRITVDFGEDSAQDELIVNTTGTADTVTLDVEVPGAAAENTENLTQPVQPDENNPNPAINDVLAGVSIPVPDTTSEVAVEGSVSVGAYGTGSSDLITVNTGDGEDVVNVAATLSEITTTINAGDGGDDITVGSEGITVGSEGITDRVDGLVVVNAGDDGSTDKLAVSDASSTGGKRGDLTATMLTGLGMATGVNYTEVEELTITLGSGADTLLVDSTHGASTEINAGNGSASQRDDTIAINTISGETTVHGEGGADAVLVNVADNGSGGFARTFANGIDATLKIHGEGGGDDVTVNLAGEGSALINVLDNGDVGDGVDTLTINGTENVDNILMRADTVALLNGGTDGTGTAERVNYNTDINDDNGIDDDKGGLFINTLGQDDKIVSDDNSAITTIDGGQGNDTFQIGQVFGTPRDARAGLADDDQFDTTAIVIGQIVDPATKVKLFDPTIFDPLKSKVSPDTANAIAAAVDARGDNEALDGVAYVSDGVSYATTVRGDAGNDSFTIYQNKAELILEGGDDNDNFTVRAFVSIDLDAEEQKNTNIAAGGGDDVINYTENAKVDIDGGAGFDTLVVLGTPFSDNFVVTEQGVYGAGLFIEYVNVESVELDTLEGDDDIYVRSTNADVVTTVIGGLGNDNISVAGDITQEIATTASKGTGEFVQDGFTTPDQDLAAIKGALILEGGVGPEGASRALQDPVLLPGELNDVSQQIGSNREETDDIDTVTVYHADNEDAESGDLSYRTDASFENKGLALTGFGMGAFGTGAFDETDTYQTFEVGDGKPALRFEAGITFNGFESLEVLLGSGDETLTISDTGDADEKPAPEPAESDAGTTDDDTILVDPATITAIHGGGGSDNITVTGRGNGPLVIYGDTSEDGSRYSNTGSGPSVNGTSFDNAAGDIIIASGMSDPDDDFAALVIYGGDGDDQITGSQRDDHIAGGRGADTINAEAGDDHIYGDSQFNVDLAAFTADQLADDNDPTRIANMFKVVTSADGAGDTINAGAGNDIVFGDHGVITQADAVRRIETTGQVVQAQTVNLDDGGVDTIHGDGGNDLLFGGKDGDFVYGDEDSDLIFGDYGSVVGNAGAAIDLARTGLADGAGVTNVAAQFSYTSDISSDADTSAGADTLYGGSDANGDTTSGNNIILGQQGADTIYGSGSDDDIYGGHNVEGGSDTGDVIDAGAGNDVVLGDNGLIERTASATDPRFAVLSGAEIYDDGEKALVADSNANGANPDGVEARRVELFDHSAGTGNDGSFGNDVIAGGADDDVIFGQLGEDAIHGDGNVSEEGTLESLASAIADSDAGGDDYIEGNGGNDTIYGGLGQDDIVGGSSSLYNLQSADQRPDGADEIHGGNGDATDRNNIGDNSHSRDADVILGDNGNIFRLVGTNGTDSGAYITFGHDNYDEAQSIVVRATSLLDYTQGETSGNVGEGDVIRGEAGDDVIYGMAGDDALFGDAQDDDLIGGVGNDWISGGTGTDGVLGDDGRIYTSRNGTAESLYGIEATSQQDIDVGKFITTEINTTGELSKSVNLTPFDAGGNDIIYGGLGDDFLHGGAGDDAISGAEALAQFYDAHENSGNVLGYNAEVEEFAAYNENDALSKVQVDETGAFTTDEGGLEFLLNFDTADDGKDRLFGDLGNDWLVGGGNSDHLYGGLGDDLLNADDDHETDGGANTAPDDDPSADESYADIAVGGGGRDVLIGNTATDRLIDWAGEFNSYVVPFSPFGRDTISRSVQPALIDYLYALSAADGADATRAADTDSDPSRNGEPFGELGIVTQKDAAWGDQTGKPADPQPGNGNAKKNGK